MSRKKELVVEKVLVIPAERLEVFGDATGFIPYNRETLEHVLNEEHMQFLDRTDELEANPKWKQLIPYMLLTFADDDDRLWVFNYTRTKQQGESRLHGKRSIGIGGHVNSSDIRDDGSSRNPFFAGARRELLEEVHLTCGYAVNSCMGFLYDPSNDVGKVHLGVVMYYDLDYPAVLARECSMANAGFVRLDQLMEERDQFESWSQLVIDQLAKGNL